LKKIFEKFMSLPFTKDREGRTLFHPWGILGNAYIVESREAEEKLRKSIKQDCFIGIPFFLLTIIFIKFWILYLLVIGWLAGYAWKLRKLTKTLEKSSERLTFKESTEDFAQKMPMALMIIGAICILLMFFAETFFFIAGFKYSDLAENFGDMMNVIFSGVCFYVIGDVVVVQIKHRCKNKK